MKHYSTSYRTCFCFTVGRLEAGELGMQTGQHVHRHAVGLLRVRQVVVIFEHLLRHEQRLGERLVRLRSDDVGGRTEGQFGELDCAL